MSDKGRLNREAVVGAAAQIADTEGLDNLTLTKLAEQLGIRTPSLFNHISGLAGLRRDLALLGLSEITARLSRTTIGKAGDEAVFALAHAYRAFAKEHRGLYTASVVAPIPGDEVWLAASDAILDILIAVLAAYRMSEEDALHAIRGLRSIVHGFVSLEVGGGFGLPIDVDESFRRLVGTFVRGLHEEVVRLVPTL